MADSLYSQDDLFFPVQADVAGAGGGLQLRSVVVPFATFTGRDAMLIYRLYYHGSTCSRTYVRTDIRVYNNLKGPPCCAGTMPTELGRCTAMGQLQLYSNGLNGKDFCAQIARRVYECTAN